MTGTATPTLIQSLQRGLQVIDAIRDNGPLTAKAISGATNILQSTTYQLVRTLVHEGYLYRLADGCYDIGPQLISVSALERRARSISRARDLLLEVAIQVRAHMLVGVFDGEDIVIWSVAEHAGGPPIDCWPGTKLPGHATAVGKNVLARMLPGQRAAYLHRNQLRAWTSQTIVAPERLFSEMDPHSFAHSESEYLYGVSCCATSLGCAPGIAALAAAYDSGRSPSARAQLEGAMMDMADDISIALCGDCDFLSTLRKSAEVG